MNGTNAVIVFVVDNGVLKVASDHSVSEFELSCSQSCDIWAICNACKSASS